MYGGNPVIIMFRTTVTVGNVIVNYLMYYHNEDRLLIYIFSKS